LKPDWKQKKIQKNHEPAGKAAGIWKEEAACPFRILVDHYPVDHCVK